MKVLAEMAEANDYQIWIERVDSSGTVGFVLEDGHVKGQVIEATAKEPNKAIKDAPMKKAGGDTHTYDKTKPAPSMFDSDKA